MSKKTNNSATVHPVNTSQGETMSNNATPIPNSEVVQAGALLTAGQAPKAPTQAKPGVMVKNKQLRKTKEEEAEAVEAGQDVVVMDEVALGTEAAPQEWVLAQATAPSETGDKVAIGSTDATTTLNTGVSGGFSSWAPMQQAFAIFGGAVAVAAVSNSSSGSSGSGVSATSNTVSGAITAGPVQAGHGLSVIMYKADGTPVNGTEALSTATVDATGKFSLNVGTHTGVVIAKVVDATAGADYADEASGVNVDLAATLMAVGVITGGSLKLNINPLTAIAAQIAGLNASGTSTVAISTTMANDANTAVAKAFGLTDITTTDPNTTNDATAGTNAIGAVLAALSGADAINGSVQTTINNFVQGITLTGTGAAATGTLSPSLQTAALQGAAVADPAGTLGVVNMLSDAMLAAVTTTGFTIGDVATDNIIKPADGLSDATTITGTVAVGTAQGDLGIKFGSTAGTGTFALSGTAWTYTLSAADVTALTMGADGALAVELTVASDVKGRRMVLKDMTDDAPTAVTFANQTISIYENAVTTTGIKVADIVIADVDGYMGGTPTVGGADAASFNIVAVAGKYELWLNSGVSLDKETKPSFAVTVLAGATASQTLTVAVADVNEAPTGANATLTVNEDTSRTFTSADFGFSDAADSPANALAAVIITTLPTAGTLKLSGVDVTLNQSIAVADLPNLVYAPALNGNGTGYATIGFKVQDNGGTANGGVDTSATANTLTIDVTAVNDLPVLTTPTAISLTDTAAKDTFTNQTGTLNATDVENDTLSYGISNGITGGSFVSGGITYDISKVGTYGTLYVVSTGADKGKYAYVANATAINALTTSQSETFSVTVADAGVAQTATLTVNVTGADDAPVLRTNFVTDGTPSTGDDDYVQAIVGQPVSGNLALDFVDPDTGDGAPTFELISVNGTVGGTVPGVTLNTDGTITGTPTDTGATYPLDYTIVVRAKDASNPALYTDHTYVVHMLKAPVVQSFTVVDAAGDTAKGKSGDALTFSVVFTEPVTVAGAPKITFTIDGNTVVADYTGGTGTNTLTFTGTAPAGNATSVSLTSIDLNDGMVTGNQSTQDWAIATVGQTASYTLDNTPPVVTASYSVNENTATDTATKSVTLAGTDTNGPITWTGLTGTDAASFSLSGSSLSFVGVTDKETKDSYSVSVTGTDASGNATTEVITVGVNNVNEAPTATAPIIAAQTAVKNQSVWTLDMSTHFADVDVGDTLTYSIGSALPAGLTLNPTTGVISGTPTGTAASTTFTITATDAGGLTVIKTFDLQVVSLPKLASTQVLDGVTNLDVRSALVIAFDQDIALGSGKIKIFDDANSSGWSHKNWTTGETVVDTRDNDIEITLLNGSVTAVTIAGIDYSARFDLATSVIVNGANLVVDLKQLLSSGPGASAGNTNTTSSTTTLQRTAFDWDFGSDYHVEFDAGIVSSSTNASLTNLALSDATTLNFKTVTPTASANAATAAAASQIMDATGASTTLSAGMSWISGNQSEWTSAARVIDMAQGSGSIAVVMDSNGGTSRSGGLSGNVQLNNFSIDDLLYLDNHGDIALITTNGLGAQNAANWATGTQRTLTNTGSVGGSTYLTMFSDAGITPVTTSLGDSGIEAANKFGTHTARDLVIFG